MTLLMRTKVPSTAVRVRRNVSFPSRRRSSIIGIDRLTDGLSLSIATVKSVFPKSLEAGEGAYSQKAIHIFRYRIVGRFRENLLCF